MHVLNVEKAVCLFSTLVYTLLDTTVFKAYNVAHLPYDELPPLCDLDRYKVLADKAFVVRAQSLLTRYSLMIIVAS